MNNEISNAITELNENVNKIISHNNNEISKIKSIISGKSSLPLSGNTDADIGEKSDFVNFIRSGHSDMYQKSLNENSKENGGYFVSREVLAKIDDKIKELSPMRAICKSITISSNAIDIIVDAKLPDAGWVSSTDEERDETDTPEIFKIKIPVHEIYAKPLVNQKLLDDSQIDIEDWLVSRIAEKISSLENNAFINGKGSDKPNGFLSYESEASANREFGKLQHFCSGADGKFNDNDSALNVLIDMVCSLKPKYMKHAKWIMSRSALAEIRKLKNKSGEYLWSASISEMTPSTLLGYPVIIDDDMPELEDGKVSTSVAFGDFYSGYQIVDRQELKILRDPYTSKPFVEFYATKRTGGAVVDFDAIKLLHFKNN